MQINCKMGFAHEMTAYICAIGLGFVNLSCCTSIATPTNNDFMKKTLLTLGLCALSLAGANAQNLYLKLSAGAGIGTANAAMRTEATTNDNGVTTTKVSSGSLGSGGQFGFAAGYAISDVVNLEVGGQYLLGFNQTSTSTTSTTSSTTISYTRQWRVIPQVIFNIGDSDFQPYTRFGVVVPVGGKTVTEMSSTTTLLGVSSTTDRVLESRGTFSLGWTSGAGVRKNLGDRSFVYADLGFQSLSIGAKTRSMVMYKVDGRDVLPDLTTAQKETEFVREYTPTTPDASKPSQTTRTWSPFSNLALTVGLQINL